MTTCYECGKEITTKKCIITSPPVYLIKLGVDFSKTYHTKCYHMAEKRAAKELRKELI